MIDHFNNMLRHLFITHIDDVNDEAQVSFQPPDETWRSSVSGLSGNALNVYLVDLRENRNLRSNQRVRKPDNGFINETPAPRRIDCHYLISAWSPASIASPVEPTADELALLYQVTAVLMNGEPLVPREVYAPNPLPSSFPEEIADAELPSQVLPVEGFPKLAEFWGQMGEGGRWKPAVYLIVTLPVVLETRVAGPMVTTRITEYRQTGEPDTAETWIQIGGRVLMPNPDPSEAQPVPLVEAWVRLETTDREPLQVTETNEQGRFSFGGLRMGNYWLRVRAPGFAERERPIGVPAPDGSYDVQVSEI